MEKVKNYPKCVNDALQLIRVNFTRISKPELARLAVENILYYEFEKNVWIKRATSQQELQCVDCLVVFMESERDEKCRDFVFDLLFGSSPLPVDTKTHLELLVSYAVSLVAKNTLEAVARWILLNVNSDSVSSLFDLLIRDQFMLRLGNKTTTIPRNLINLGHASPLFASIFVSIVVERLANHLMITSTTRPPIVDCLSQVLDLLDAWLTFNPNLPLHAIKQSLTARLHSNRLNIVDNLARVAFLYPLSGGVETNADQVVEEHTARCHLTCMKLLLGLRDLTSSGSEVNLIDMKTVETLLKKLDEFEARLFKIKTEEWWLRVRSECIERLVECLELCWKYRMSQVNKREAKVLLNSYLTSTSSTTTDLGQVASLLLAE